MPVEEFCLGLESLGTCMAPAGAFLSLGEGLLLAALLFAYYRFASPLAQLRLRSHGLTPVVVLSSGGVAVMFLFVAAALRLFGAPWTRAAVVGYPAFWELAAALLFALLLGALAASAVSRAKLTARSAAHYLTVNRTIIAGGNEDTLRALGSEICEAVPVVAGQCRAHRDRESREGPVEADPYTRASFALLDAWADPRFCNVLVRWCPETAMAIVAELTEHAVFGDGAVLGAELVNQALSDERSMLYREARQSGLRRQKVMLKAIFGSWPLLDSAVRPLGSWNVYQDRSITERKIQRWGEAVDNALSAFMENGEHGVAVFRVRQGLETLNHLCSVVLAERERSGAPWTSVHDRIYEIAAAFRTVVRRIRTCNLPAPVETNVENYDPLQDETLHGAIAEELFHFLGSVCTSSDHEFLDWISMGPWKELFEEGELTTNLRALQVRVAHHITLKIDDNLDVTRRFPPPITRLLFVRYPLTPAEDHARFAILKDLETYFLGTLSEHFQALWKANRAFAETLLPDNVDYDDRRAVFRIRHPRRDTQTIALQKPTPVRNEA